LAPIRKFFFVDIDVDFGNARLQIGLDRRDRLVLDGGADLDQEKSQQAVRSDIADRFIPVFKEVALDRFDSRFVGLL
jgi:hypothetical protein